MYTVRLLHKKKLITINSNNGTAESLQCIEEIIFGLAILTSVYLASRNE